MDKNKSNYCVDCIHFKVEKDDYLCISPDLRHPVTFSPFPCRHLRGAMYCRFFEATDEEQRAKNLTAVEEMTKKQQKTVDLGNCEAR